MLNDTRGPALDAWSAARTAGPLSVVPPMGAIPPSTTLMVGSAPIIRYE
jgi:hypothetical protein